MVSVLLNRARKVVSVIRYCSPSSRGVLGNLSHAAESQRTSMYQSVVRLIVSNFRIFTAIPLTLNIKDYSI